MNLQTLLITTLFSLQAFGCKGEPIRNISTIMQNHSPTLMAGGRSSLHGMVVFGNGSYFVEHIPMLHPPHDIQIVASIVIKDNNGKVLKPDLSQVGFTLKPKANFSLNDFIEGSLSKFDAEIYQGSFEQEGKVVIGFENITIEVQKILLARQLPKTSNETKFEVADVASNTFQTGIITPQNNTQIIKNISTGKTIWCVVGPDFFQNCPD
jgi:hypothetical protein